MPPVPAHRRRSPGEVGPQTVPGSRRGHGRGVGSGRRLGPRDVRLHPPQPLGLGTTKASLETLEGATRNQRAGPTLGRTHGPEVINDYSWRRISSNMNFAIASRLIEVYGRNSNRPPSTGHP